MAPHPFGIPVFNSTNTGNLTHWIDITVWKGIPFAATTGGQNRWKAPQLASSAEGYTIDEDCLNLNIWSPTSTTDAKLPAVMWSYPALSTAVDALFDGGGLADKGMVFVSYNYRSGAFGWLATPELTGELINGKNSWANWDMVDQFAALKWIKANIAASSAGSAAMQHILNSELTKGLIDGAILEFGVRYPQDPLCTSLAEAYRTLEVTYNTSARFLSSLNVTTLAEARALPMEALTTNFLTSSYDFTATLHYYAMPDTYHNTLTKSLAQDVPRFLGLYPATNSATASGAYNSQFTGRTKVGTWLWSQLWRAHYESPAGASAYHESEMNYVLNNLYATDKPWTDDDYRIAERMSSYRANSIKTGDPNGEGLVRWPAVNPFALVQHIGDGWARFL
ncbi:alpha/beta-hydrolase [Aspergillus homomorphus CBS 101889]|uniref:Alpha/beta-hydrolase n=1 Tax=Aspergillus homomorphus (strain CBS 101889) TaxID=1450537 RepID=A0A395HWJ7_ASPHC|nr:alpha/beta-hydrolase [Aspergillus homomorphus CBS 101889]RAL11803.1 alpha/beta-hydrolase [Aspergillus homomorphus CBS 101889]